MGTLSFIPLFVLTRVSLTTLQLTGAKSTVVSSSKPFVWEHLSFSLKKVFSVSENITFHFKSAYKSNQRYRNYRKYRSNTHKSHHKSALNTRIFICNLKSQYVNYFFEKPSKCVELLFDNFCLHWKLYLLQFDCDQTPDDCKAKQTVENHRGRQKSWLIWVLCYCWLRLYIKQHYIKVR